MSNFNAPFDTNVKQDLVNFIRTSVAFHNAMSHVPRKNKDWANAWGVTQGQASNILNGHTELMSSRFLADIADYFNPTYKLRIDSTMTGKELCDNEVAGELREVDQDD